MYEHILGGAPTHDIWQHMKHSTWKTRSVHFVWIYTDKQTIPTGTTGYALLGSHDVGLDLICGVWRWPCAPVDFSTQLSCHGFPPFGSYPYVYIETCQLPKRQGAMLMYLNNQHLHSRDGLIHHCMDRLLGQLFFALCLTRCTRFRIAFWTSELLHLAWHGIHVSWCTFFFGSVSGTSRWINRLTCAGHRYACWSTLESK